VSELVYKYPHLKNIGTALLPAITGVIDYSVKQRDVAEKVESAKKVFEIKGELDKYVEAEKENINEEDAVNNFQKIQKLCRSTTNWCTK
jgi:hypothetical protein